MRCLLLLACLAAACGGAPKAFPRLPSQGGPVWLELTGEHTVVWTDLPEKQAEEALRQVEQFHAVMNALVFHSHAPPQKVMVLIFRELDDWQLFGTGSKFRRLLGFHVLAAESAFGVPFLTYCAESASGSDDANDWQLGLEPREVRQHILGHLVTEVMLPVAPAWLEEGMASYFATIELDDARRVARVGRFPKQMLDHLRETGMDSAEVTIAQDPGANMHRQAAHLRSHVLFSYLLNREPDRFATYQRLLKQLPPSRYREAWDLAFQGLSFPVLEKSIDQWLNGGSLSFLTFNLEARFEAQSRRRLTDAEVSGTRAAILMLTRAQDVGLAREHALAAIAGDPNQLAANVVLFLLEEAIPEARARALISSHPESGLAWAILASTLPAGSAEREEARTKACQLAAGERMNDRVRALCE